MSTATAPVDINTRSDLQRLMDEVVRDFQGLDWEGWSYDEFFRLESFHAKIFADEAAPDGFFWPDLAPSTIAKKGHDTILVDTDRLRRSLALNNADSVRVTENDWPQLSLVFGTEVPYSRYHSRRDGKKGGLPTREHVGVSEEYFDAMAERAVDHAFGQLMGETK